MTVKAMSNWNCSEHHQLKYLLMTKKGISEFIDVLFAESNENE